MKKILFILFPLIVFICSTQIVLANSSMPTFSNPIASATIKIPGMMAGTPVCTGSLTDKNQVCKFPWIGNYIQGLYTYGLSIAGILATIVMMFGGLLWLTSQGNSQQVGEAKAWIGGATTGLLLLFCTFLIMNTVNPELTSLKPITVSMIAEEPDNEPESLEGNPTNTTACPDCVDLPSSIETANTGRKISKTEYDKLIKVANAPYWVVTEAWPNTGKHKSKCHPNGTCMDIALRPKPPTCENVNKVIENFKAQGFTILNEYTACNGTKTTYTTGGHIHVR